MKPTRKELIMVLAAVQRHVSDADVLFEPGDEGEHDRVDAAQDALHRVDVTLRREKEGS